jgi:glutamate--cysteine ligase
MSPSERDVPRSVPTAGVHRPMVGRHGFLQRLRHLSPAVLTSLRRGIEKESLRVQPDGTLARTLHPATLGAALTHPHITTDFSEAQLELITGVHTSVEACLAELAQIHQVVDRSLGDRELLWCASMPCKLPADHAIPIAQFGRSNVGRAKTVYRIGLSHRYGRRMQTISGIHYNFSLPEAAFPMPGLDRGDDAYFALIRNFRRHAWLLLYLFGASPAVCASFVEGRQHDLLELAPGTLYLPHATSLRMGRLGYLSEAQDSLAVSYNDLASYTASLYDALTRPYPPYEAIGLREGDDYRQLATTLLQIENEFYSPIRPKRVIRPGERPLHALRERGVQYVEDRAMDLDPFTLVGINASTVRFLDVFLLHCLLADSPPDSPREIEAIGRNKQRVASRGREPGLQLERGAQLVELREWAGQLLVECTPIARALDAAWSGEGYQAALAHALAALEHPESLPSARVLEAIEDCDGSYLRFVLQQSLRNRDALREWPLSPGVEARFKRLAQSSIDEQRAIEAADTLPFEAYRQRYLSPERLLGG